MILFKLLFSRIRRNTLRPPYGIYSIIFQSKSIQFRSNDISHSLLSSEDKTSRFDTHYDFDEI